MRTLVTNAYSGENHQTPPEALYEAPLAGGVSLSKVDEAGEGEDTHEQ